MMELQIQSSSGKSQRIQTDRLMQLKRKESFQVAAQKASIFFALAMASIFIPVFHFVLVPLFLLLSAITFWRKLGVRWKFEQLTVNCVQCNAPLVINESFEEPPFRIFCNSCHQHLQITIESQS